uniref:Bestrophin homolog n=1 Tax=Noctiluca scintillans TaxID=2966 RepID=A0A7S1B0M6_NOCSC|mmetsp:Transcript_7083/g.19427  ORF Transcript_7083/g.19427 Transcript_7083/m.19427 type:complete len:374 (+) Transcript_7083:56-1177(+)|eukprot:CAMPEP_0194523144 /NCGR_PEP_ID=MMETSP0253-20130528/57959_1 /TAXON_ID=2966 /ORGANISM="Noctiluca scintillans" /LENGTH=373 /DNA_ID=CAMNT_0039367647 /DNA_START=15 /DNA_END=1136 /DNA_ORIENTATION=+
MIEYEEDSFVLWNRMLFKLRNFRFALLLALSASIACGLLHVILDRSEADEFETGMSLSLGVWGSFTSFVAFLLTFRTGHAYGRFMEGCDNLHSISSCWIQVLGNVVAFCNYSTVESSKIRIFQQTLLRLASLTNAMMYADLEGPSDGDVHHAAFKYSLIDPGGLGHRTFEILKGEQNRAELTLQWTKLLVVNEIKSGVLSIPPPILTRVFQELDQLFDAFAIAVKLADVPFPYPYAASMEILLIVHTLTTPLLVINWTQHVVTATISVFILTFSLWVVHLIAPELENPFGHDTNDLDMQKMQEKLNLSLLTIVGPAAQMLPQLVLDIDDAVVRSRETVRKGSHLKQNTFNDMVQPAKDNSEVDGKDDGGLVIE